MTLNLKDDQDSQNDRQNQNSVVTENQARRNAARAEHAEERTGRVVSSAQDRINSEEKFKTYKTAELISDLSRGIERLRQQEGRETVGNLTGQEIEKTQQAISLALELHIDQKDRPSGEPYVNHVLNVARRVVEYGVTNANTIIAAVLHDSVEDQSPKLAELNPVKEGGERQKSFAYISSRFGERVANIIRALSNEEVPEHVDVDSKNRIYREHIATAIKDPDVALIKLADFSDNALTLNRVTDLKRRLKLAVKYLPVVEMFITRLQDQDIQVNEQQKRELVGRLTSARGEMERFVVVSTERSKNKEYRNIFSKDLRSIADHKERQEALKRARAIFDPVREQLESLDESRNFEKVRQAVITFPEKVTPDNFGLLKQQIQGIDPRFHLELRGPDIATYSDTDDETGETITDTIDNQYKVNFGLAALDSSGNATDNIRSSRWFDSEQEAIDDFIDIMKNRPDIIR